jgi:hypothetical protein
MRGRLKSACASGVSQRRQLLPSSLSMMLIEMVMPSYGP